MYWILVIHFLFLCAYKTRVLVNSKLFCKILMSVLFPFLKRMYATMQSVDINLSSDSADNLIEPQNPQMTDSSQKLPDHLPDGTTAPDRTTSPDNPRYLKYYALLLSDVNSLFYTCNIMCWTLQLKLNDCCDQTSEHNFY